MQLFFLMLVILNPFAQVLYLQGLIGELSLRAFTKVHTKASLLTAGIFVVFALVGEPLLRYVFQVHLESLQIFGGLIMVWISYRYITAGPTASHFAAEDADLAPRISLPYMVGPGTLWTSILLGETHTALEAVGIIALVLAANFIFVVGAAWLFNHVRTQAETSLGKFAALLMRTTALLVGAVGIEMTVTGLQSLLTAGRAVP